MTMNDDKRQMTDEEMALELRRIIVEPEPGDHFPVWDEWLEADKESALQDLAKVRELLCPKAEPLPPTCERCGGPFVEVANFDGEKEFHHNCDGSVWDASKAGSNLADAVRAKDAEIADLRSKLEAIGCRLVDALDNSENAAWSLDRLHAEAAAKDAEITDLKQQVERCRNDGSVLRDLVARLTKERDELRLRLRETAQILISETGANGPMNAGAAASLAVSKLNQVENERDEMKSRAAGLENELSMVRKDFARACKERDELKAKAAQAASTVEPTSNMLPEAMVKELREISSGNDGEFYIDILAKARELLCPQDAAENAALNEMVEDLKASVLSAEHIAKEGNKLAVDYQVEIQRLNKERDDLKELISQSEIARKNWEEAYSKIGRERDELRLMVESVQRDRDFEHKNWAEAQHLAVLNGGAHLEAVNSMNEARKDAARFREDVERLTKERDELKAKAQACQGNINPVHTVVVDEMKKLRTAVGVDENLCDADALADIREQFSAAKAHAACGGEPLSEEEIAKLVEHYLETDMGYTGFNLARDVAAAQRAKAKAQSACTIEPLTEAEISEVLTQTLKRGEYHNFQFGHRVAAAQRAKVRPVELPTVSRDELGRTVRDAWSKWVERELKEAFIPWKLVEERYREAYRQCGEAVLALLRERMGGGK
jgi:Asp-tRNA(Asn)/Glu-tRNA(Gln) amidotransferase C subunit